MRFMFLGILGAYLLGNLYVFIRGWQALPSPLWLRIAYPVLFWAVAFSLFIALFTRGMQIPSWLQGGMYNIGSVWMVFTLYMVLALLAVDVMRGIASLAVFLKQYGFWCALAFTVLLLVGGYINYMNPKVEQVDISIGESGGKARIVAISDVHLGYATDKKQLQSYVKLINSLSPDIILIAGDLIDNSIEPVRLQNMQEELGQLVAPQGIYMVPGNHEYISGKGDVEEFLIQTPIILLKDSVVTLSGGLRIAGRDDRSNRSRLSVAELLSKIPFPIADAAPDSVDIGARGAGTAAEASGPVILLDHQPYGIAENVALGVDLQFSGHTHRGQVWPMSLIVGSMYEQPYGYRRWGDSHVIVSSGLSLWGPPFRIGTNSDLWLINLRY